MSFSPTARSWVCLQGLSRSTKRCGWFLICCLFLSACSDESVEDRWCGNRTLESGDLIVLNTDFGSSSVDVARPRCEGRWEALYVGGGDLAIRLGQSQFYALNRATNGSLTAISKDGEIRWQAALSGCGLHDIVELSDDWGLLTCYDDNALRLVSLSDGEVFSGPNLSEHADLDGLAEPDQMILTTDGYLMVSLQRLDREDGYRPAGPGRVVRGTLRFNDSGGPEFEDWRFLDVDGLENPVTALSEQDGLVSLGFAGDWQSEPTGAGRAFINVGDFTVESLQFSEPYRLWQSSGAWWVESLTRGGSLEIESMALRLGQSSEVTPVWEVDGFSIGGIAEDGDQNVYVTYRPADGAAALVSFSPTGEQACNMSWPLKPWEVIPIP